jgi:hypothetical protein
MFAKTNKDGTPKRCKFCHEEVWWHGVSARWYNTDGETLHVETCPRRAKHYHDRAMDGAESRRQRRKD